MIYRKDVFSHQYLIVGDFVQHLAYYRGTKAELESRAVRSEFWAKTCDAHLEAATLDWCKVFGSDGPNPTHWKKTSDLNPTEVQKMFRQAALSKTGFSQSEWDEYHNRMCRFRDRYVAHVEVGQIPPVPLYDKAFEVACAYDEWVRTLIAPDFIADPTLDRLDDRWKRDAGILVESAILRLTEKA